ncbi:MAG: hypothetical protein WBE26_04165, partial [Phycisphaerae bacterium]
ITAGRAPLDHRTDIYSLGATLYELLTLAPPFPGERCDQIIAQIIGKDPIPPRRHSKKVPVDLETICHAIRHDILHFSARVLATRAACGPRRGRAVTD